MALFRAMKPEASLRDHRLRGGVGQVLDAPELESGEGPSVSEQAREWQIAVEQAETVAKVAGKLPGGAVRALEASQAAKVDWRELLRRAWSDTVPADYSWTRPNRRHVWSGIYLPGITSEGAGEIAIAVDCSGSVSSRQVGLFDAEIRSILAGERPPAGACAILRSRGSESGDVSGRTAGLPFSGWRRRNGFPAVLRLA